MNSLSWTLYLADVVQSLNIVVATFWFVGGIGGCLLWVMGNVVGYEWNTTQAWREAKFVSQERMRSAAKKALLLAMCAGVVGLITPTTNTVYMIAASQAGEVVLKDPEMQGIFNDLKTIIKQKIKDQLPKQS